MFYDRQVRYFDDMVNGEKRGNGGFVKIEVRDRICNITLCVKGLGKEDCREVSVYLEASDRMSRLCILGLQGGCGTKQFVGLNAENIGDTGIAYSQLQAVKILLSTEREFYAFFAKKGGQASCEGSELIASQLQVTKETVPAVQELEETLQQKEVIAMEQITRETIVPTSIEETLIVEKVVAKEAIVEETVEGEAEIQTSLDKKAMPLKETKWKQLWEIYPRISPFQDGRKYLSVGPGDFVILPEKYFAMVNNSFLLHGYYNYHHLVLKRMEAQGQIKYYIGVPGNYYDREKQVAVMFGFEGFEGMQEPAKTGDFGYYFKTIEL